MRSSRRIATAALLAASVATTALFTASPPAAAAVDPASNLVINEVYGGGGNGGAPINRDFVELFNKGTSPINLSGYTVQYASVTGSSWQTTPLTGTIAPGGYLLVGEAFGANTGLPGFTPDVSDDIAMSGSNGKVALVNGTAALTCGTGCATLGPVVDFVGWGPTASSSAGNNPAPITTNAQSVTRNASHTNTANNGNDFAVATPTPQGTSSNPDPDPDPDPEVVTIAEIQGTGPASPLDGDAVITRGVVTAEYPTGGFNAYVIQTPGTGGGTTLDGHTASHGLYVFSAATLGSVAIGDYVEITGTVDEFSGLTELVNITEVEVLAEAVTAPLPLQVAWPATEAARESIESMLLQPAGAYTVSNTYTANQFSEVGLAVGTTPLMQPTDVFPVSNPTGVNEVIADNDARALVLDDGASTNFLSGAGQSQTPPYISLTHPIRVGAGVTFPQPMIVDYRFDLWRVQPTTQVTSSTPLTDRANFVDTRTATPDFDAIGGDLQIAGFNVLNYFTTLGADTSGCVSYDDRTGDPVTVREGCNPRGAWDPDDFARQQTKIVEAINGLEADVVGLMEIENSAALGETVDEATASLVAALNADAGAGTWAFVPSSSELPSPGVRDVITNALIYRTSVVDAIGSSRALGTESDGGEAFDNAREPIGQAFVPDGGGDPFFVAVNHFKSKGSGSGQDADQGDGQGASNFSRVRQANALVAWVPTVLDDIPGTPVEDVFLIGDFNAYTQEDPMQVFYSNGYQDVNLALDANVEQSYSFDGLNGSLDHVVANEAALDRLTGSDIWTINSPESISLEYSRYNYHGTLFHEPNAFRSSDHDPVIVGLEAGGEPATADLTLLGINDFHGRIDTNTVKFAGTVEQLRAAGGEDDTLFVSGGDNIGASLFASAVAEDQPTIDVLNALELDASAVGNHEFDQGFADLVDRVIGTDNADWDYLGANVYEADGTTPALDEYAIYERAGLTVAVVGAVTQETPTLVSPGGVAGLVFGDPVAAVNRVAAQLSDGNEANGEADVIIASYHEGAPEGDGETSTIEEEIAESPVFAGIVLETSAEVDAIFTGHSHRRYAWEYAVPGDEGRTRPIVQTGNYGEFVGEIVLTVDTASGDVVAHTQRNVARTTVADSELVAAYPRVAAVKAITDAAIADAAVIGNEPIGSVTADITTAHTGGTYGPNGYTAPGANRDDRTKESTIGDLVADSLLDSLADPDRGGAQIGVANPGGLRAELLHAPDGVITYAEANAVLPFVNNLWTVTLTGAQFKTVLEQQWQRDAAGNIPTRSYLQLGLSDNVSYTFDPARAEGDRITSITVDGGPIDPEAEYRIGTFSFLVQGGDNFRGFLPGTDARDSGLIDRDAWIDYLGEQSPVAPDFARQATIVTGLPASVEAGEELTFSVSQLDLTSLGSPANDVVTVSLDGTEIGTASVTGGAAAIDVTVPADTPAGSYPLTVTAAPSGTVVTLSITVTAAPTAPAAPADFDGDGDTDLAVFRPSNNTWYIDGQDPVAWGLAGDIPVAGDYDGDSSSDVAVFRPSTGRWYVEGIAGSTAFGVSGDIPVPGQWDADPETDIAVFRPSLGRWYVEGTSGSIHFGLNGDIPVPGQWDADPETDVAVYRPTTGRWYIDGVVGSVAFGVSGDIPVPGQWDADPETDVAVFRPSTGRWYVEGTAGSTPFGLTGDLPVPALWDAEAGTDVAVFRPSTGRWYIDGVAGSTPFGADGDIPVAIPPALRTAPLP